MFCRPVQMACYEKYSSIDIKSKSFKFYGQLWFLFEIKNNEDWLAAMCGPHKYSASTFFKRISLPDLHYRKKEGKYYLGIREGVVYVGACYLNINASY